MSAHTPGPWVFAEDARPRPEVATVAWVGDFVVGIPTPGFEGGNYRDADYGTDEADARLIAAAPDLLEALEFALRDMEATRAQFASKVPNVGVLGMSIATARAAIAKARGQS